METETEEEENIEEEINEGAIEEDQVEEVEQENHLRLRNRNEIRKPKKLEDYEACFIASLKEPTSFEEAMKSDKSKKWKKAIENELSTLKENKTWIMVDKPAGNKVIDSSWVLKLRRTMKEMQNNTKQGLFQRIFNKKLILLQSYRHYEYY